MASDKRQLALLPKDGRSSHPAAAAPSGGSVARDREAGQDGVMSLHISKLRGIDHDTRMRLKQEGISYTDQLLEAARDPAARTELIGRTRIDEGRLVRLVRRADLARIKGIGAIFADILDWVGVPDTAALAASEPVDLHRRLAELNAVERLARRAPTPEEVAAWIAQARALPWRFSDG